ncbi:MAG: hypothetical protein ACI9EW_003416 [Cellvibrionaceae bacterium]|jgi:hypothetical protein
MKLNGSCLCGEIKFELRLPFTAFGHCYCSRCRKATGAGRASVFIAKPENLQWTKGEEKLNRWDLPSASSFATSFCSQCGSHLPRLTRSGEYAVIPAGSIDDDLPIQPECHENFSSKANWVDLDETNLPIYNGDPL